MCLQSMKRNLDARPANGSVADSYATETTPAAGSAVPNRNQSFIKSLAPLIGQTGIFGLQAKAQGANIAGVKPASGLGSSFVSQGYAPALARSAATATGRVIA